MARMGQDTILSIYQYFLENNNLTWVFLKSVLHRHSTPSCLKVRVYMIVLFFSARYAHQGNNVLIKGYFILYTIHNWHLMTIFDMFSLLIIYPQHLYLGLIVLLGIQIIVSVLHPYPYVIIYTYHISLGSPQWNTLQLVFWQSACIVRMVRTFTHRLLLLFRLIKEAIMSSAS